MIMQFNMQFGRVHQRAYQADVQSVSRPPRAPQARNGLAIQPVQQLMLTISFVRSSIRTLFPGIAPRTALNPTRL